MNVTEELLALETLHARVGTDFRCVNICDEDELVSRLHDAIDCIKRLNAEVDNQSTLLQHVIDERNIAQTNAGSAQRVARAQHDKVKQLQIVIDEERTDKRVFRDALNYIISEM